MKKFVSIKDVELNEMKKKELVEANGGCRRLPGLPDILDISKPMCGLICYPPGPWDVPRF